MKITNLAILTFITILSFASKPNFIHNAALKLFKACQQKQLVQLDDSLQFYYNRFDTYNSETLRTASNIF